MAFPALLLGSFSAALYATPRWLAYPAAAVPTVAMSLAGLGEITYAPAIAIPARTMRAWHALVWIRLADREAPRRR